MCQKSSQYGIILQSYYTSKKGAIFYDSRCMFEEDMREKRFLPRDAL